MLTYRPFVLSVDRVGSEAAGGLMWFEKAPDPPESIYPDPKGRMNENDLENETDRVAQQVDCLFLVGVGHLAKGRTKPSFNTEILSNQLNQSHPISNIHLLLPEPCQPCFHVQEEPSTRPRAFLFSEGHAVGGGSWPPFTWAAPPPRAPVPVPSLFFPSRRSRMIRASSA